MNYVNGSNDNSPFDSWHTLEMALLPSTTNPARIMLQLWHDGNFVAEGEVSSPEIYDETEDLYWLVDFNSGSDTLHPFSGQIDTLRSGFISMGNENE